MRMHESDPRLQELDQPVAEVIDGASAELLVAELRAEGVPARIRAIKPLCGLPSAYCILVAPKTAHRARWILRETDLTDRELTFLATGELGGDDQG